MSRNYFVHFFSLFFFVVFFSCFCFTSSFAANVPVIFYSDLTSGPKTGGQNNKGVFVTVWGKNFGAVRGASTISVGGGLVNNYPEWSDTKICFQLGANVDTGNIVVSTNQGISNGIPFVVRAGHIYFVSPNGTGDGSFFSPFSPFDYISKLAGGEKGSTAYFRAGTYNKQYGHQGWHSNFCLMMENSGTSGHENAFVAFPGENVIITSSDSTGADRSNFRIYSDPAQYITISKFNLYARNTSISTHTGWRVVGNSINALHSASASGAITTGFYQDSTPHDIQIYGNEIAGGSSGEKLDHAIYPGSGVNYLDIGWNLIHDNNFGAGPMISLNCNDAFNKRLVSRHIYIHDNKIDVSAYPARAIGVFETGQGSDIYIYNNVITGVAPNGSCSVYAMSGNVYYYNNTFFNTGAENQGATLCFYSSSVYGHQYAPESITIINNIISSSTNSSYYIKTSGTVPSPMVLNNLFANIASPKNDDNYSVDSEKVISDPMFIDANSHDFRLSPVSPANGKGKGDIALIQRDFEGKVRPQLPSIGAFESEAYENDGDPSGDNISPPSGFTLEN